MKFITEDDLRTIYRDKPFTSFDIEPDSRLTPGARQFLQDRQINVFAAGTFVTVLSALTMVKLTEAVLSVSNLS